MVKQISFAFTPLRERRQRREWAKEWKEWKECIYMPGTPIKLKERKQILFVYFPFSVHFSLPFSFRLFRFMYDTSNNILKLSIQLLHIYGNLVKAWFTISLLFFFFFVLPTHSLNLFIQQPWPCPLMLFGFWTVAKPIVQNYRNYWCFQAMLRFLRTVLMFDNFASRIDGFKKSQIHIIHLTKWRYFFECW